MNWVCPIIINSLGFKVGTIPRLCRWAIPIKLLMKTNVVLMN